MMKKIFLITPNLNIGGAQKVLLSVAKYLSDKKNIDVYLLVMNRGKNKQQIPENINIRYFNCKRTVYSILPLFFYIKRNNPTHILSTLNYMNFIVLFLKFFYLIKLNILLERLGSSLSFFRLKNSLSCGKYYIMYFTQWQMKLFANLILC